VSATEAPDVFGEDKAVLEGVDADERKLFAVYRREPKSPRTHLLTNWLPRPDP
jgi:hypothetical protein